MDGKTIGAAYESNSNDIDPQVKMRLKGDKYFNSGVLLIDPSKWVSKKIESNFFGRIKEYRLLLSRSRLFECHV